MVDNGEGVLSSYVSGHRLLTDIIDADGVRAAVGDPAIYGSAT